MTIRPKRNERAIKEHVLVAAVTAAERGDLMPATTDLAERLKCRPQDVSMAMLHLERKGLVKRLGQPGFRQRVLVVSTGAATAEVPRTAPEMRQLRRSA